MRAQPRWRRRWARWRIASSCPAVDGGQGADEPQAQEQTATAALGTIEKDGVRRGRGAARQPARRIRADGRQNSGISGRGRRQREGRGTLWPCSKTTSWTRKSRSLNTTLQTAQQAVRATQTHTQYVYKQLYDDEGYPRFDTETGEPLLGQYSNEIRSARPRTG